jgi:2-keto-3-deoxy-L-rhamnonate aldolase RhmA
VRDVWSAMEAGEVVVGHWVASGSPTMVELMAGSGADLIAIDCEHGPVTPYGAELDACLRAAYAADITALVRVSGGDPHQVSRAADLGAAGVIVPHVNTAAQLRELIAHVKFPPLGNRGCAPTVRAARWGWTGVGEFIHQANASAEVVPLLEEPEAFENLDELLAVEGLRAVAIGPLDLAIRLGGADDAGAQARVRELLGQLLDAATPRGISVIDGAWDLETFTRKVQAGARGIMYSGDVSLLVGALREQMGAVFSYLAGMAPP